MRGRRIEENWVVNLDRSRRNNVAKADVYLNGNARPIDGRMGLDSNSAILKVFADWCCRKTLNVEGHTIVWNSGRTYRFEGVGKFLRAIGSVAEQIQVSRWPEGIGNPRHKEQGALEDEAITVLGDTKPIEQSLQCVPCEKNLVVGTFRS